MLHKKLFVAAKFSQKMKWKYSKHNYVNGSNVSKSKEENNMFMTKGQVITLFKTMKEI